MQQAFGLALSALMLSQAACVTVLHRQRVRGPAMGIVPDGQEVRVTFATHVSEADVATVERSRVACTATVKEYAVQEEQQIQHPRYGQLVVNGVLLGMGGVGIWGGQALGVEPAQTGLSVLGGAIALIAAGSTVYHLVDNHTQETRHVATAERHRERLVDCGEPMTRVLRERLPFVLHVQGQAQPAGETGWMGHVDLRAEVGAALASGAEPEQLARAALAGQPIGYALRLGEAPVHEGQVDPRTLPDSTWQAWVRRLRPELAPPARLRLRACQDVAAAASRRLHCLWNTGPYAHALRALESPLESVEHGEFAASWAFEATSGQAFTVHVLTPAPRARWLLQVVALQTGQVVAESFASSDHLLSAAGRFPAAGDYVLVVSADTPGAVSAYLAWVPTPSSSAP